ncbi:MAG TPA: ABC transporter substrate-binding protein [Arachidicoccus sp.]
MNKILRIALLLTICLMATSQSSQAQFWKKIFHKEEPKPKKAPVKKETAAPVKEVAHTKAKKEPEYPASQKDSVYTIDVFLPLYLNNLVKDGKAVYPKPPEYAMGAINFYEGISIAAQALSAQQVKLEINIHDLTQDTAKPEALIAAHKLDKSNLILAYVQSNDIPSLAKFAKQKNINFVSVLSPADADTKDNPYFILIQPTLITHVDQLVHYALGKYARNPKYILNSKNSGAEIEAYQQIKRSLTDVKDVKELDCTHFNLTTEALAKNFDSTKTNILFIGTLDIANTEKILNAIAALPKSYHFEIFGMPSWKYLKGLTSGNYMGLSIRYTSPFYYDPTTPSGQYVNTEFSKTYDGEPTEMVYRGYESIYWFSNLLHRHGTIFNKDLKDVSSAPFTRYEIKPAYSKEDDFLYLENNKLYILHYQNGGYVVEGN